MLPLLLMGCASSKVTLDWPRYPNYILELEGQGVILTIRCSDERVVKTLHIGKNWYFNHKTIEFFGGDCKEKEGE